MPVTGDQVLNFARGLARTDIVTVHGRRKARVKAMVYASLSHDETLMGFACPKEERAALVAADPVAFRLPGESDLRYHWVVASLAAIDLDEAHELLLDAWGMVVPQFLFRERLAATLGAPASTRPSPVSLRKNGRKPQ